MSINSINKKSALAFNDMVTAPLTAQDKLNPTKGSSRMQWLFAIFANFCTLTYGLQAGWMSPMLPILKSDKSPTGRPLTESEVSWIASMICLMASFGVPFYSFIVDKYGRRAALIAIAVPQAICWCLKLSSANTTILVIARTLSGLAGGGCFIIVPIYVKELAQDSIRGSLGSILILARNFGMFTMFAMGAYMDYFTVLYWVVPLPFVTILILLKAPESPSFLVKVGNDKAAASALAFFRGLDPSDTDVQNEISKLRADNDYYMSLPKLTYSSIFKERPWRRAFILMMALMTVNSLNGTFALITFASSILSSSGVTIRAELAAMSCPAIMAICSLLSVPVIERFGRKPILAVASLVVAFSVAIIGVVIMLQEKGTMVPWWIPVLGMGGATAGYAAGVGPLPYIIQSEMFNFQLRAKCMGLLGSHTWFVSFLQLIAFEPMSSAFGPQSPFFLFALCDILGVFILAFLPETRGKSPDMVEDELRTKRIIFLRSK